MKAPTPTEENEQRLLADWLDLAGVKWCHVPNGGARVKAVAGKLKAQGVKAGVPDVLIFDRPPSDPACVGVAFELKRADPRKSRVTVEQAAWLVELGCRGWATAVAYGADDAITKLRALGFGARISS